MGGRARPRTLRLLPWAAALLGTGIRAKDPRRYRSRQAGLHLRGASRGRLTRKPVKRIVAGWSCNVFWLIRRRGRTGTRKRSGMRGLRRESDAGGAPPRARA